FRHASSRRFPWGTRRRLKSARCRTTLRQLDDEARALHDSWDSIVRIVLLVAMLSVLVWAACSALRMSVHSALDWVLERGWMSALILLGALIAGGMARGPLLQRESWQGAVGDGMSNALENYHITYEHEGDDPQ